MTLLLTSTLTVLLLINSLLGFFSFICCCFLYFSATECPPYDLVLWTDGSVPFPFGKHGSGVLANCSLSVALRPPFSFQQAQYAQVFPLKPGPFCKLFAGLDSTNKCAISLLSSYQTLALSSPPFFLLP